jgi:hypothetical protein
MLKNTIYTLIISIIIAIISIAGYVYGILYVGGMGGDLGDMYNKSNELSKEEEVLNSIKRVAQNAEERNIEISQFIIPVENEGSIKFVKTLENTADRYGLKSNTNSIEIVSDDNLSKINKEYLSVKMTLVGSEQNVSGFVKKIESMPFNTKITSYSLTNSSSASNKSTINDQQLDCTILVIKEK